jgi:hypothetical protein
VIEHIFLHMFGMGMALWAFLFEFELYDTRTGSNIFLLSSSQDVRNVVSSLGD